MANAVLDVQDVPDLLISKFHTNTISWREEAGVLLFQPIGEEQSSFDIKKSAFEELKKFRGVLPKDFDYKNERLKRIDEKYDSIH
ncbi:MAG: hypothetical protein FWB85_12210 [Chitinispirillia bacterium]|nr:hypothetical protein [Chitinispirillia bacterium]MCL2242833.1 hypothetical protein [Chitinispirillia bacterium]